MVVKELAHEELRVIVVLIGIEITIKLVNVLCTSGEEIAEGLDQSKVQDPI
jgi:hypothetical protein